MKFPLIHHPQISTLGIWQEAMSTGLQDDFAHFRVCASQ